MRALGLPRASPAAFRRPSGSAPSAFLPSLRRLRRSLPRLRRSFLRLHCSLLRLNCTVQFALQWQPPLHCNGSLHCTAHCSLHCTAMAASGAFKAFRVEVAPAGRWQRHTRPLVLLHGESPTLNLREGEFFLGKRGPRCVGTCWGPPGPGAVAAAGSWSSAPAGAGQEEEARAGRLALRAVRLESFDPAAHAAGHGLLTARPEVVRWPLLIAERQLLCAPSVHALVLGGGGMALQ